MKRQSGWPGTGSLDIDGDGGVAIGGARGACNVLRGAGRAGRAGLVHEAWCEGGEKRKVDENGARKAGDFMTELDVCVPLPLGASGN